VMVIAVGLFAALTNDVLALIPVVALAWLVVNGFLVDRLGELSWHGWPDLFRLSLLACAGYVGLAISRVGDRTA
jgi:hypothetical protein